MKQSFIHLIRHGHTEGSMKRWYYGRTDLPLATEGVNELTELVKQGIYPSGEGADFYTSGLLRTEQTFFLIYGNEEHAKIPELQEISFGDYETKTYEDICDLDDYQYWVADKTGEVAPPGGESFGVFGRRVDSGFEKLRNYHKLKEQALCGSDQEAHSILVCHGGVISKIMASLFDEDKHFYQWIPDPGHGYSIALEDGKPVNYIRF